MGTIKDMVANELPINTANFGAPGSIVAGIPAGTGILVMAADEVVVEGSCVDEVVDAVEQPAESWPEVPYVLDLSASLDG